MDLRSIRSFAGHSAVGGDAICNQIQYEPNLVTLTLENSWVEDGHYFVRWSVDSRRILCAVKSRLDAHLKTYLSRRCAHIKNHGGVKGSVRYAQALSKSYRYVARFDIRAYYESINHDLLLGQLVGANAPEVLIEVVRDYLVLPDKRMKGAGMVAGGPISPLLGALYLTPLDRAMESLEKRYGIKYQRYMDDFLIFTSTRQKMRMAIRVMHKILEHLKLSVHPGKRYIGKTEKGFDFLGYRIHPNRLLRPAKQSLDRLNERCRRLYEQGGRESRLRRYVQRWYRWLLGGLGARVCRKGRFTRIWKYVLNQLSHPSFQSHVMLTAFGS